VLALGRAVKFSTRDISADGAWFRDAAGRYILLRGICFGPSAKLEPHTAFRSIEDWARFETYVDLLWACGWRILRLAFFWSALEPECDPETPKYDEAYIESYFRYVDLLAAKGFLIIIDLHQDLLGKAFGGNGMPAWVQSTGTRKQTLMRDTPLWGLNYVLNRNLRQTFTDFWSNDLTNSSENLTHFKVRDRYLDMVDRVAQEAANREQVFGIEIFNEPHPARIEDRRFEEEILPEFYRGAVERMRKHSRHLYAFLAPQSDWNANVGREVQESFLRMAAEDHRAVFAYHYYDSLLTGVGGRLFSDAKRDEYIEAQLAGVESAKQKGMTPFLTEFGTRQNWARSIVRRHMDWQYEAVENALVSATYWNVNLYNTHERLDGFMREDFSLLGPDHVPRNLDVACRPYVIAASAKPTHQHFNLRTKEYHLVLQGRPIEQPTVIYLPSAREHPMQPVHYDDFVISYNSEIKSERAGNELRMMLDPTLEHHDIIIRRK
jgi:endoglycosylceramidase